MERAKQFLTSIVGREEDTATLSRRDALAGLLLGALLVATAKFVAPSAAEGKPLDTAASPDPQTKAADTQVAEASDATDLSSRRYWRRRRHWRRRWRRRYWFHRRRWHWRRRYWRRRYWRRRYWY